MRARDVMSTGDDNRHRRRIQEPPSFWSTRISALPVVEGRDTIVRIVSEIDLIRHVLDGTEGGSAGPSRRSAATRRCSSTLADHDAAGDHRDGGYRAGGRGGPHAEASPSASPSCATDRWSGVAASISSRPCSRTPLPIRAGAGPDDESLRRMVMTAVHRLGIPGRTFDVVVRHGVAHLWGRVSTEEEDQACRWRRRVPASRTRSATCDHAAIQWASDQLADGRVSYVEYDRSSGRVGFAERLAQQHQPSSSRPWRTLEISVKPDMNTTFVVGHQPPLNSSSLPLIGRASRRR